MSAYVEVVSKRELAVKIHYWAQDILKANQTCGLGKTPEGKYQVVWPGLINQWIYCPDEHGQYLGTLSSIKCFDESVEGFGEWKILLSTRCEQHLRQFSRRDAKRFEIIKKKIRYMFIQ